MLRRFLPLCLLVPACGFQVPSETGATVDGATTSDAPTNDGACTGPDSDGDGVPDACDPCPNDATNDSDGDTVCDSDDVCPGSDDRLDADGDGVPDGCDDWPCGARPAAPPDTVTWLTTLENVTLWSVSVAGQGRLAVVAPGASLPTMASFSIIDCQCVGCIDQIELGFEPGGKQACLYNGNPQGSSATNCPIPTVNAATRTLTAPAQPGVHQLRFNRGNDTSCQANGVWWASVAPPASNTIALVCVN